MRWDMRRMTERDFGEVAQRHDLHLARLRLYWPQAWISNEPNRNGEYLLALPGYLLCSGWNATICTVLWLARLDYCQPDRVGSPLDGFWVDLPALRLADGRLPQYSRGAYRTYSGNWSDVPIRGFPHWKDLTHFWWHAQCWDPNTDSVGTHIGIIRKRLKPAR
jgi:hypothetical protein